VSLFRRIYAKKQLRPFLFILLMGVVVSLAYGAQYLVGSADVAKVGQCMNDDPAPIMRTTDCDNERAKWKIVGRTEGDNIPADEACAAYPQTSTYLERTGRGEDYVLCLTENPR
jgi:hypothetical protein